MPLQAIRRSIAHKVQLAMLVATFIALLIASSSLLVLDIRNYEATTTADLRSQAEIMAQVTLPAIEFDDAPAAQQNLTHLHIRQ